MRAARRSDVTETDKDVPGTAFWGIAGIALIWNLMVLTAFQATMTMSEQDLRALPVAEQAFYTEMPVWVNVAFAVAVIGGLLGSLALILRRRWAVGLFALSLVGVVIQRIHMFFMSDFIEVVALQRMVLPILVFFVAVFLLLYSMRVRRKGWLT